MVTARRPSVTTALGLLRDAGRVERLGGHGGCSAAARRPSSTGSHPYKSEAHSWGNAQRSAWRTTSSLVSRKTAERPCRPRETPPGRSLRNGARSRRRHAPTSRNSARRSGRKHRFHVGPAWSSFELDHVGSFQPTADIGVLHVLSAMGERQRPLRAGAGLGPNGRLLRGRRGSSFHACRCQRRVSARFAGRRSRHRPPSRAHPSRRRDQASVFHVAGPSRKTRAPARRAGSRAMARGAAAARRGGEGLGCRGIAAVDLGFRLAADL